MNANIKLELKTLTPPRLIGLVGRVHSSMAGNAHFPTPPVSMAHLEAKRNAYDRAVSDATDGSRAAKAKRNNLGEEVKDILRQLANYARTVAVGDAAILSQSGFDLARVPQCITTVGVPEMGAARMSWQSGTVSLRWSGVRGRRGYFVYMAESDPYAEGEAQWVLKAMTGKVYHDVHGLVPYKPYWFRVSALGPTGEGGKSQVVLRRAA
jgi:hypothetical protein